VIVCSKVNLEELGQAPMPNNITVLCDVPIARFDEYVQNAKTGIIALRHDTGSAGQSVALALMRNAKCILATRAGDLVEYIEDGVSGYWIDDVTRDLPAYVRQLDAEPGRAEKMGEAGRQRYAEHFSLTTAAAAFENVLATVPCGEGRARRA
jgi:glycosyltransferase involved in cell wall biosynthesis